MSRWLRKRAGQFLMGVVLLFLLIACGTRPAPPRMAIATPTSVIPSPAPSPDDNTLIVIGRFTGEDEQQLLAILDRFSEETGIQTEYRGNGEVAALLNLAVEEGYTPDVILLPKVKWLHELADGGAIVPLNTEVASIVRNHFNAAWQSEVTHDSTLYGVPFDANLKSLLWYRPAPTLNTPETLNDLTNLADLRAAEGQASLTVAGGAGWMLTDWFENVLLATAGTDVYDALITHTIPWTDSRVVAAAEAYLALLQPAHILDGPNGATLPLDEVTFGRTFSASEAESLFWLGQGSIVTRYATAAALDPGNDYTIAPFPTDGALVVVGSVAVGTNNRSQTQALLGYLAHPESVEPWVQAGGFISPNLALPAIDYPTTVARTEAELLSAAPALRPDLSDQLPPLLGTYLGDQLREMLLRPDDVETILAEIEQVAIREQGRVP